MLSPFEAVSFTLVLLLIPPVVWSLVHGSPAPQNSWITKYFEAEKRLNFAGNLFVLAMCMNAAARLAIHFGVVQVSSARC